MIVLYRDNMYPFFIFVAENKYINIPSKFSVQLDSLMMIGSVHLSVMYFLASAVDNQIYACDA